MSALVAPILADTMKRLLLTVAGMAMGFVLPAIAQQTYTLDPQTTRKLRAISKAYDEAVSNNDAAAVGGLFTEDAVFVSDRGPIHGRQAIQQWYIGVFQVWHPKNHIGTPDGSTPYTAGTTDSEAWESGAWSESGRDKTGRHIQIKGYWSTIYVREGDNWKIAMLTYNVTPTHQDY
jgi:ketosteroid isomerase-like protein